MVRYTLRPFYLQTVSKWGMGGGNTSPSAAIPILLCAKPVISNLLQAATHPLLGVLPPKRNSLMGSVTDVHTRIMRGGVLKHDKLGRSVRM
jgi:hypothetical protein